MIFNNLDWLIVYQMDSFLDLTSAQEKNIKLPVREVVTWIKAERLPAIIELLRDVETAADARKIDSGTYRSWVARVEVWRGEITERITPPLAILLKQLDAEQIEHLQKKLGKSDRNLVELLESSEREFPEGLEEHVEDAADGYKFWFGKLRKDQKEMLVAKLRLNRAALSEQLKQRRRAREFWINLIRTHDRDQLVTALRQSAEPQGGWRDPEYLRFRTENRARIQEFMVELFASLDQEQWLHFQKVIKDLIADAESLAISTQGGPA